MRQKQEWRSELDGRWVRTGCNGLWDAVLLAFRDYREADPTRQSELLAERTGVCREGLSEGWEEVFYDRLCGDELVARLLPRKLVFTEVVPYIRRYVTEENTTQLEEEVADKCFLLAEYRQEKKGGEPVEGLRERIASLLRSVFVAKPSHDEMRAVVEQMGNQLIVLSPREEVLFDSGGDGCRDVIIVLAHPDGSYDSVGRMSFTKDGHQKISRLFRCDDDVVEALRKS